MNEKMIEKLREDFVRLYGENGEIRFYFAPGRVNLIGEHTDYNGGHVFPCALTMGIWGAARVRKDRFVRLYSANVAKAGVIKTSLDTLEEDKKGSWADYPKGVFWAFEKFGHPLEQGMDIVFYGNIPSGSGLSSSAAIEVLTGVIARDLGFKENAGAKVKETEAETGAKAVATMAANATSGKTAETIDGVELAKIGQYGENEYNGMNCGIMDQFASAMGKENCAIFLDTNTLSYEYAPLDLGDASIVIINSKVKHSLVSSAYNDRRRECAEALADLQKVDLQAEAAKNPALEALAAKSIHSLGDLTPEEFDLLADAIKDPVCRRRARHAVAENERTIQAVAALREGDLAKFGQLMNASHVSLRDDYEVSCPEMDLLTEIAWSIPGVLGSRMTGGGFGGCTVSIVKNEAIDTFRETITTRYEAKTGHTPEIYIANPGPGATRL